MSGKGHEKDGYDEGFGREGRKEGGREREGGWLQINVPFPFQFHSTSDITSL